MDKNKQTKNNSLEKETTFQNLRNQTKIKEQNKYIQHLEKENEFLKKQVDHFFLENSNLKDKLIAVLSHIKNLDKYFEKLNKKLN